MMMMMAIKSKGRGEGLGGSYKCVKFLIIIVAGIEGEEILYTFYKLGNRWKDIIDSITVVTTIKSKNC